MNAKRVLIATVIGNWVEWYNFLLFIYLEPIVSKLFFPMANRWVALTAVYGLFAAGFLARPFGSLLFGYIGDKYGRQKALLYSLGLLTMMAWFMALMPTYQTLGILSPILVALCRILQGLSAGGEHMGSAIYLLESAPPHRKAFWTSFAPAIAAVGVLSGSCAAFLLVNYLPMEKILAGAWRMPFLFGALLALYGIKLRWSLPETPLFKELQVKQEVAPAIFSHFIRDKELVYNLCSIVGLVACWAVFYNVLYIGMPSYLSNFGSLPQATALKINNYAMCLLAVSIVVSGYFVDRVKPLSLLIFSSVSLLLVTYPLFKLINSGMVYLVYFAMAIFTLIFSMFLAATLVFILQVFSTRIRYTAVSLGFNISLAVFGGTAPLLVIALIHALHNALAPAYYLMLIAAFAGGICIMRRAKLLQKI